MADYIFKGSLADNPLPEVLLKIHYYKVPGVLTLANAKGRKEIFISGGEVIFAASTLDDDRLGEFLLAGGRITQDQYDRSVQLLKSTGKRQGAALVEIGALTPQDLYRAVKDQVVAIVWSLFNWMDGEVTFRVGKYKEEEIIKLNLDTRTVIVGGIKRIEDAKRVVKWMGRKEDVFEPTPTSLTLLPTMPLTLEDKKVFRLADGNRSFLEIIQASAQDSGQTAKILYALFVLGLIQRKDTVIRITAGLRSKTSP